ncbi:hypothetical protein V6N11_001389 [Hibiscus sabdariffa]|uniref:Uncharacterized protein n=1 Tax=Hibiscus sabdariffa TaxID=183260 RepID=A0ABR2S030_9ROSI
MSRGCEARQCDVEGSMMGCHIADAGMIFVVNFIQYDGKYWKLRKVSDILYSAALPAESIVAEPQTSLPLCVWCESGFGAEEHIDC